MSLLSVHGPAIQMDWTIWKTAEPITTKMNRASSSGDTGYESSCKDRGYLEVGLIKHSNINLHVKGKESNDMKKGSSDKKLKVRQGIRSWRESLVFIIINNYK